MKEKCTKYNCEVIKKLNSKIDLLEKSINYYKYDFLTGLALRKDFESILDNLWHEFKDTGNRFIYAIVDINNLKKVNIEYGRLYGDSYITSVATQLKEQFEDSFIYRIGGDEFCVIKKGNEYRKFIKRLNNLTDVEYGVIQVKNGIKYKTVDELSASIDHAMTHKKIKSKNRRKSDEIQ